MKQAGERQILQRLLGILLDSEFMCSGVTNAEHCAPEDGVKTGLLILS